MTNPQPTSDATPTTPPKFPAFPATLHPELEEYDRRAAHAEPIHYFSDNRHPQYVCRECMVPVVSSCSPHPQSVTANLTPAGTTG